MVIRVGRRKLTDFRIKKAERGRQISDFKMQKAKNRFLENIDYPFTAVFKAAIFVYVRNIFIFVLIMIKLLESFWIGTSV